MLHAVSLDIDLRQDLLAGSPDTSQALRDARVEADDRR
jgi:hypothetical protein